MLRHSTKPTRALWAKTAAHPRYVQFVYFSTSEALLHPAAESSRKPAQVERAIRIKSQERSRRDLDSKYNRPYEPQSARKSQVNAARTEESAARTGGNAPRPFGKVGNRSSGIRKPSERSNIRRTSEGSKERPVRDLDTGSPHSRGATRTSFRDNDHGGSAKSNTVRDIQFKVSAELNEILRDKAISPEEAFSAAEEKFETLTSFQKRNSRLYTAMIRSALRAKKRQRALGLMTEMKKNGVAPSIFTFRALFEGMFQSELDLSLHQGIIKDLSNTFEELVATWTGAIAKSNESKKKWSVKESKVEGESDGAAESSTARSYERSKRERDEELMKSPHIFVTICEYYYRTLLRVDLYEEADALLESISAISNPRQDRKSKNTSSSLLLPHLQFLLTRHYIVHMCHAPQDPASKHGESLVKAWKTLVRSFLDKDIMSRLQEQDRWQGNASELDRHIASAQIALEKHAVPGRQTLVEDGIKMLYQDDNLASFPPIVTERTIRMFIYRNMTDVPFAVSIFEKALDFQDQSSNGTVHRFNQIPQFEVLHRDVQESWHMIIQSVIKNKDLDKAMELTRRYIGMIDRGMSRFDPKEPPKAFLFTLLIRLCCDSPLEERVWQYGLETTRNYLRFLSKQGREEEIRFCSQFIEKIFLLARRYEQSLASKSRKKGDADSIQEASKKGGIDSDTIDGGKSNSRPSRALLDLLEEEIGLDSPLIWSRYESIVQRFPKSDDTRLADESSCIFSLSQMAQVTRFALNTGRQGSDVVSKEKVDKWKKVNRKASEMLATLGDNPGFDGVEADFLRHGATSKTSLALTNADLRSLIG
ncbi:hypothetical protein CBS101457_000919 [Exobasidium rhododendri]|nr:hypothetical protein CBS101457_000919 [Exobasidium rhododendri]